MRQLLELLREQEQSEQIGIVIAGILAVLFAVLGVTRFFFELRAFIEDIQNKWIRPKPFKVKRTILKAIAKNNQTQVIKLRTLRLFKPTTSLDIDGSAERTDDKSYPESINQFSIPGVVTETHTRRLPVTFRNDEVPKVPADFTYVTSKVLNATMEHLWGIPGIVAEKPVGSDSLTVEFFCAPGWRFRRNALNKPEIDVYWMKVENSQKEQDREHLPAKRIISDGGSYAFDKTDGEIDWIRVVVKDPPKDADVSVDWFWDAPTEKRYQAKLLAQQPTQTEATVRNAEPKPAEVEPAPPSAASPKT